MTNSQIIESPKDYRVYLFSYTRSPGKYQSGNPRPAVEMVQPYKFDAAGDPQGYGDELVKQGEWLPGFSYTELIPATQLEQAGVVDIEATKRTIFTKMGDSPKWTPSAFALASEVVDWCAEAWKLKGRE